MGRLQQASRILLLGFEDAWPRTAWPGRREAARIRYRKLRQARRALWVGATLPLQAGALRCRRLERMIDLGAQEAKNRWRWSGDFAKQIRLHVSPLSGSIKPRGGDAFGDLVKRERLLARKLAKDASRADDVASR